MSTLMARAAGDTHCCGGLCRWMESGLQLYPQSTGSPRASSHQAVRPPSGRTGSVGRRT